MEDRKFIEELKSSLDNYDNIWWLEDTLAEAITQINEEGLSNSGRLLYLRFDVGGGGGEYYGFGWDYPEEKEDRRYFTRDDRRYFTKDEAKKWIVAYIQKLMDGVSEVIEKRYKKC